MNLFCFVLSYSSLFCSIILLFFLASQLHLLNQNLFSHTRMNLAKGHRCRCLEHWANVSNVIRQNHVARQVLIGTHLQEDLPKQQSQSPSPFYSETLGMMRLVVELAAALLCLKLCTVCPEPTGKLCPEVDGNSETCVCRSPKGILDLRALSNRNGTARYCEQVKPLTKLS